MIKRQDIKDKFLFGIDLLKWNLSIVLYLYLIVCLLIKDTEFFYNHSKIMNWLDTPFFIFMAYHFVKNYSKYSSVAQNCAWCMLSVLLIKAQEISSYLANDTYYNLYYILIFLTALFSVWDNLNFRFIKK